MIASITADSASSPARWWSIRKTATGEELVAPCGCCGQLRHLHHVVRVDAVTFDRWDNVNGKVIAMELWVVGVITAALAAAVIVGTSFYGHHPALAGAFLIYLMGGFGWLLSWRRAFIARRQQPILDEAGIKQRAINICLPPSGPSYWAPGIPYVLLQFDEH